MEVSSTTDQLFDLVHREVEFLWADVALYQALFASDETLAILNRKTAKVFEVVKNRLWDAHNLRIDRLLSPPSGKRGETHSVSFISLVNVVRTDGHHELASNINKHLMTIRENAKGLQWNRNKLVAHHDLDARLGKVNRTEASFADVKFIADEAIELLNCYSSEMRKSRLPYPPFDFGTEGPDALIAELQLAQRWRDENPNDPRHPK
jgi:hypothetical protein